MGVFTSPGKTKAAKFIPIWSDEREKRTAPRKSFVTVTVGPDGMGQDGCNTKMILSGIKGWLLAWSVITQLISG